ncbi:MAG: PTS sugar transporter subunit IIA [Planctomycetota bacterium]|nr:PTS sugar transporter subunit IIA [Planctomycetota bacterium]
MLIDSNAMLVLAIVIVGGLLAGRLARGVRVAAVTGQILLGVLIGHSGLSLFPQDAVEALTPVTHLALGLIAVVVGSHLNLRRLRGARLRLGLLLLGEMTITPAIVYVAAVYLGGAGWRVGMLLAAMAVSTAPATIVALVAETRSRGVFTKTLVGAVALNNIACILLFEVARMASRVGLEAGHDATALEYVLAPLRQLVFSGGLGGVIGVVLVLLTRHVIRSDQLATFSLVCVMLVAGLAESLGLSSLLACLFLGFTIANLTPDKDEIVESAFVGLRAAIFGVFFTLAGMHLDLQDLIASGMLVAVVFVARAVGKMCAARLSLTVAGATQKVRQYLGIALIPQAGVAVGLMLLVRDDPVMAPFASSLLAVGIAVVTLSELTGPFLVRHALLRSGEAEQDRDRILEFLHEENIVVGLDARSKEGAIEQLVDVLIRSNHLDADRDQLLKSVLDREAQMSTCFGEGLSVPHGILPTGSRIVGAMGISKDGWDFSAPDGRPVHVMVVLATPETGRARHLQVLAALAKALGTDHSRQRQLYAAATPAHAWEILHADDESQDFNYFIEE